MLLKRHYAVPDGWEPERGPDGQVINPPPVRSVSVKHTGTHPAQNFSRRFVDAGLTEGWVSMHKGVITLHTEEEDLMYTIVRMPGTYCCHCDVKLEDDTSGASGRRHVGHEHAWQESPDPSNPAGFRVTHAYECLLDEAAHARWNAQAIRNLAVAASEHPDEGQQQPAIVQGE